MMKFQKWLLIASVVILLGVAALAAFSFVAPFARAQGPGGWYGPGDGSGPMFGGGFGSGPGMGGGQGMMPSGAFGPGFGMGPGGGPGQMGMGGRFGGPENSLISVAAEKLGMTTDELMAELQADKSIAEVAAEKNVAVDTIVDAVITPRSENLKEQVANGQLTQEQADAMVALMKANLNQQINAKGLGQGFGRGMGNMMDGRRGGPENSLMATVTEKLGLTQAELATELQAGKSIADVAKEKNVSVGDIAAAILAPRADRLNELVADGQLTQAEVDNYLANQRVEVIERLNQSRASQNPAPGAEPGGSGSN
ncbi:MAG: hypothetical protein HYR94_28715 [Chloroflexi bacterium]|nr:hypothetical protein [Chloroflexota bacterium]